MTPDRGLWTAITLVLLSDVHMQPLVALTGSPVLEEIGKDNLFGNLDDALSRAREYVGAPKEMPPQEIGPTAVRDVTSP